MDPDLLELHQADLLDHGRGLVAGTAEYSGMRSRDADRRAKALAILQALPDPAPADLFHVAWILNHGETPEEIDQAHHLARRSAESGHPRARWLAAATLDRSLMYRGLPQRHGTQIVPDGVGHRVWDVDPTVTDDERAANDVPPLADQIRRAAEEGEHTPQPPMDQAPGWLREAVARWSRLESPDPGERGS